MAPLGSPGNFFPTIKVDTTSEFSPRQSMQSLGTGSMSPEGLVSFFPILKKLNHPVMDRITPTNESAAVKPAQLFVESRQFLRTHSSFLRVADLDMDNTSCTTLDSDKSHPNFHHPAVDPPPGVAHDPKEKWIALNDGDGSHAPIAPMAMDRLANFGLITSMDHGMWSPDGKTDRLLKKGQRSEWMKETFKPGCVRLPDPSTQESDVMVWSGNFKHGLYGSDLPAVRAAGVVNMSAKSLMALLVDSTRVKEYNKLSLGRTDLVSFQDDMTVDGSFGHSITKVMKSENKPPLVRKTLVFVSILHAKELIDGSGYLIVTRAVHHPEEEGAANAIKSEILMGVNLIRKIEGAEDSRCLMINVNHIRSPLIPMMIAKRIGVSAAVGFVNDIRSLC
jgi:hypothetical protein